MKKVFVGLGLASCLVAAGCSSGSSAGKSSTPSGGGATTPASTGAESSSTTSSPSASESASTTGAEGKTVTFIPGIKSNPFYVSMGCGAAAQAQKYGIKLKTQGGEQFDPTVQIPVVNGVIASKPDAVMISPTDSKALLAPMKQMKQRGIKIIQVDTTLDDTSPAEGSVSSDNVQGGRLAAEELSKLVGGSGSVVVISLKPGVSTDDLRVKGFTEGAKKYPGLKQLDTQYDEESSSKAESLTNSLLSAHPDLKGIFTTDFFGVQGAAAAIQAAHKSGEVKIVTFDATQDVVTALKQGQIQAVISQSPYEQGVKGMEDAYAALTGKPVQETQLLPTKVITKANVDSPDMKPYLYLPHC